MSDIAVQIDTDVINVTVGDDPVINVTLTSIDVSRGAPFTKVFISDGITAKLPFDYKFKSGSLLVFLSGIFQGKGSDYTEAEDGKSITFTVVPKENRKVEVFGAYDHD